MEKKVLLLAVSCKTGGLCPGGLDMEDPSKWIRIVRDDGHAGAVQAGGGRQGTDHAEPARPAVDQHQGPCRPAEGHGNAAFQHHPVEPGQHGLIVAAAAGPARQPRAGFFLSA